MEAADEPRVQGARQQTAVSRDEGKSCHTGGQHVCGSVSYGGGNSIHVPQT